MQVLRCGPAPDGWSRLVECTGNGSGGFGCHALLEASQWDLFKVQMIPRPDSTLPMPWVAVIKCPICTERTVLCGVGELPKKVAGSLLPHREWEIARRERFAASLKAAQEAFKDEVLGIEM